MKKKILYLMLAALVAVSISVTSCSSSKKVDGIKKDSVSTDSATEPDAAKMKKDSV